jgi:glutamate synthase (NADPH) small chain
MIFHIDPKKCTGCGICVDVCPLDTLRLDPFQEAHPPCRQRCPAGVDVRGFLFYLEQGMLEEASVYLHHFLPFPAITGLLCQHPCEMACARKEVDEAINIHGLEYYIGTSLRPGMIRSQPLVHAGKVAVIGSGPAGMSAGYFLSKMGYAVTVFESDTNLGGSLLKEVSERRLPAGVLDAQISAFREMGIAFVNRMKLSEDMNIDELRDRRYSAVFLATGSSADLPDPIATGEKKTVSVDPVTLETNIKGVFAGGGLTGGSISLVKVIASAKRAAISIDRCLRKEDLHAERECNIRKVKNFPHRGITGKQRLDPQGGFTDLTVAKEANRCMSCGSLAYIAYPEDCMTCFECEVKCPSKAIRVDPFKEVLPMTLAIE